MPSNTNRGPGDQTGREISRDAAKTCAQNIVLQLLRHRFAEDLFNAFRCSVAAVAIVVVVVVADVVVVVDVVLGVVE